MKRARERSARELAGVKKECARPKRFCGLGVRV
jgi:hypothetical protein